ncbi:MAG: zinc ribbon domain-containing protein [Flavobacteriales bacterium]|nr:zinc ribbon domain-containing protein [Flavobacteriales bacterium]
MRNPRYQCPKCQTRQYTTGEIRTTGGFWSKIFNIQNRKFISISCDNCGYTEFYNKKGSSTAENILDLFTN